MKNNYKFLKLLIFSLLIWSMSAGQDLKFKSHKQLFEAKKNLSLISYGMSKDVILFKSTSLKNLIQYTKSSDEFIHYPIKGQLQFAIQLADKSLIYQSDIYKNRLRYSELYHIQDGTKSIHQIGKTERLFQSLQYRQGKIIYYSEDGFQKHSLGTTKNTDPEQDELYLINKEGLLILIDKSKEWIFAPLGEGVYIWGSLSPDQKCILFTLPGQGTFVSDLDGTILHELGHASSPSWSYDGDYIVFMKDSDDGHVLTASNIIIYSLQTKTVQNLTKKSDDMAIYPHWAPDSYQILYQKPDNSVFELILEREK